MGMETNRPSRSCMMAWVGFLPFVNRCVWPRSHSPNPELQNPEGPPSKLSTTTPDAPLNEPSQLRLSSCHICDRKLFYLLAASATFSVACSILPLAASAAACICSLPPQ